MSEGNEGEDADFGGELQCRGQAEGNEAPDALDIDFNGSFQKVGAVAMIVPRGDNRPERGRGRCGRLPWPSRNR